MIDIEAWLRELDEEEDVDIKNNEEYQTKLFEEYVLRSTNHTTSSGNPLISMRNLMRYGKKGL